MTTSQTAQIYFLCVTDNASKQQRLCTTVHEHFVKSDRILIAAPTHEAATYIDQLLWKIPQESFTPHAIANTTTHERVAITTTGSNINKAQVLINLCLTIPTILGTVSTVYELLDMTTPEKEASSRARQSAYTNAGYTVEERG